MISFSHKGDFKKTEKFFADIIPASRKVNWDKYGERGVEALRVATPKDTGKTAASWSYTVEQGPDKTRISWSNSNVNKGVNIAIILQYGHGTKNGGYVAGRDYINPAIRPIFDEITSDAWKEVTSL